MLSGTMTVHVVKATVNPGDAGPKSACVKIELRRTANDKQKGKTKMRNLDEETDEFTYGESFDFAVDEEHTGELRVQLFKKAQSVTGSKPVVANAGVYVKNIVPIIAAHGSIDKDFKLFTKDGKNVGGSVRLLVDFTPDAGQSVDDTQASTNNNQDGGMRTFHFTEDQAAAKIQAAFKGNKTRKELQSKAAAPSGSSGAGGGNKAVILGAVAAVGIAALSLVGGGKKRDGAGRARTRGKN